MISIRNRFAPLLAALAASAAALMPAPSHAQEVNPWDGQWHPQLTLYGWFPALKGDFNFDFGNGGTAAPSVEVNPSNYLHNLRFAGMAYGAARKGDWDIFTDIVYANIGTQTAKVRELQTPGGIIKPQVDINIDVDTKALVWTFGAGYTVARNGGANLDVIGGARYLQVKASVGANVFGQNGNLGRSASTSTTENVWTGNVGVDGAVRFGDGGKWFMPYEADVGFGSFHGSSLTSFNGILGLGYHFGWGDVLGAWRYLSYHFDSNSPVEKLYLNGPALGVTFHW
jgi:hypothetical protein